MANTGNNAYRDFGGRWRIVEIVTPKPNEDVGPFVEGTLILDVERVGVGLSMILAVPYYA